jgi:hypothetical protein
MQGLFLSLFSLSFQEERNGWNVFSKARLFLYEYIYIVRINHVMYYTIIWFYSVTFSFMLYVGPNFTI